MSENTALVQSGRASIMMQGQQMSGGMVESQKSRAIAEVQAAMVIAKQFPRDEKASLDRILNACTRKGLASTAIYQYAKGETNVEGPSIRLAECIAQQWGNMQVGIRELEQSNGESIVEAFAWDVESNTRITKTFTVTHVRYTKKKGSTKLYDPREIYETIANQGMRRLRACILSAIPGDVVEEAVNQCNLTLAEHANVTPERIKAMLEKFGEYKVTQKHIEANIQRRIDSITPSLFVKLGKIYTSIKDGLGSPADYFDMATAKQDDVSPLAEARIMADDKPKKKGKPDPKPEAVEEVKAEETELPFDADQEPLNDNGEDLPY